MSLKKRIFDDFKKAFREEKLERKNVLSLLYSEIKNREIELGLKSQGKELSDEEVFVVLNRAKKQRQDSIEKYNQGNRIDLVENEKKELVIIEEYLPKELSDEELFLLVKEVIAKSKLDGKENFGKAMGLVMGKINGQADGKKIKKIVENILSK